MSNSRARDSRLLMDRSAPGRRGALLPQSDVPSQPPPDSSLLRRDLALPEVTEGEVVRYFSGLSQLNFSVDTNFYPLGSCTMKYNPKVDEELASLPGFASIHPLQAEETVQGALALLYGLQGYLAELTGTAAVSLAPLAGAHGELSGMLMAHAYHLSRGERYRRKVVIPDNAHGTNPASAAMAGFHVVSAPTDVQGNMDLAALRREATPDLAGIMLTLPNTLGIFDSHILEVCRIVRQAGGVVYGDGANMNALLGRAKLGHLGFDVMHLNLHKTFSTPHGGGGPGSGPVCAVERLAPFLPGPVAVRGADKKGIRFRLGFPEKSIGRIGGFQGNFGVLARAYAYIRSMGDAGLKAASANAVLNANYVMHRLKSAYHLPYDRACMHEAVFSAREQKAKGVRALDIAKRLLDYGYHAPTMYFPLIVEEALMIEPTETESKETLDAFVEAMVAIAREVERDPDLVRGAPHSTPASRLDEARAARQPDLRWAPPGSSAPASH